MAESQTAVSSVTNQFFTIVFGFECLVKLYTYGGSGAQFTCFTGTKVLALLVQKYFTIVKLYTYVCSGAQYTKVQILTLTLTAALRLLRERLNKIRLLKKKMLY